MASERAGNIHRDGDLLAAIERHPLAKLLVKQGVSLHNPTFRRAVELYISGVDPFYGYEDVYGDTQVGCVSPALVRSQIIGIGGVITDDVITKVQAIAGKQQARSILEVTLTKLDPAIPDELDVCRVIELDIDALSTELQRLWGFPTDRDKRAWWHVPHCTCPKLDNDDAMRVGAPTRIVNGDCIYHGN